MNPNVTAGHPDQHFRRTGPPIVGDGVIEIDAGRKPGEIGLHAVHPRIERALRQDMANEPSAEKLDGMSG